MTITFNFLATRCTETWLRRLFSLLVKYASKDKVPPTESDPPSDNANEVEARCVLPGH